jgi:hypothetical protein
MEPSFLILCGHKKSQTQNWLFCFKLKNTDYLDMQYVSQQVEMKCSELIGEYFFA